MSWAIFAQAANKNGPLCRAVCQFLLIKKKMSSLDIRSLSSDSDDVRYLIQHRAVNESIITAVGRRHVRRELTLCRLPVHQTRTLRFISLILLVVFICSLVYLFR